MRFLRSFAFVCAFAPAVLIGPAQAEVVLIDDGVFGEVTGYGDLRLRWESDWGSQMADGTARTDRDRLRYRARLGLTMAPIEGVLLNVRARTGDASSQQSPHSTLWQDRGDKGDRGEFTVDRLFLRFDLGKNATATVGRDPGLPIWKPNELMFDNDVYVDGLAFNWSGNAFGAKITGNAGLGWLPNGTQSYSLGRRSHYAVTQVVYERPWGEGTLTAATGLLGINDNGSAPNLTNDDQDYLISFSNAQYTWDAVPQLAVPLTVGCDFMWNFDDGPDADGKGDETLGAVGYAKLGKLDDAWDWQVGYWFAHIELWAVPRFFAQDDAFRFGSATQTRSSDYDAHEFRVGLALSDRLNMVGRFFLVDAISTVEDGKRFRFDINYLI